MRHVPESGSVFLKYRQNVPLKRLYIQTQHDVKPKRIPATLFPLLLRRTFLHFNGSPILLLQNKIHCSQPLTEMSTRRTSRGGGGKSGWCVGLTTLPPSCADCAEILGASTSWNHKGLSTPVMGLFYLLITHCCKQTSIVLLS
jgi:hypothetical protein